MTAQATFLLVLVGLFHLWLQLYNRWLLLIRDGPRKVVWQQFAFLLVVLLPAVGLLVFWNAPVVESAMGWSPQGTAGRALFASFALLWILALWRFGLWLADRAMPPRSVHLVGEQTTIPTLPKPPGRLPRVLRKFETTYDLEIAEREIVVPALAPEFDGFTIAQVSDAHYDPRFGQEEFYDALVPVVQGLGAQVVLFTGDFVNHRRFVPRAVAWHAEMKGRLATLAVLGNHDYWTVPQRIEEECERHGIRLMANRRWTIERAGRKLLFAGTDYPWKRDRPQWEQLLDRDPGDAAIVISHTPDNAPDAARAGANLVLAGHTHGGQYCAPLIGPLVVPARTGHRFPAGVYDIGRDCVLHVARGIGASDNGTGRGGGRTLCPPEIVLLTLRAPYADVAVPAIQTHQATARESAAPIAPGP